MYISWYTVHLSAKVLSYFVRENPLNIIKITLFIFQWGLTENSLKRN